MIDYYENEIRADYVMTCLSTWNWIVRSRYKMKSNFGDKILLFQNYLIGKHKTKRKNYYLVNIYYGKPNNILRLIQ